MLLRPLEKHRNRKGKGRGGKEVEKKNYHLLKTIVKASEKGKFLFWANHIIPFSVFFSPPRQMPNEIITRRE